MISIAMIVQINSPLDSFSVYRLWKISRRGRLRNSNRLYKMIYLTILTSLLVSITLPVSVLSCQLYDSSSFIDARFVASSLSCISSNFDFTGPQRNSFAEETIYYVIAVVGGSLFLTTIINALIVFQVHIKGAKVGNGVPRRTLIALGCVTWLFVASYLPIVVYAIWSTRTEDRPPPSLHTILNCSMGIHVCCNPIIYAISNDKFRGSVSSRFSVAVSPISKIRKRAVVGVLQPVFECDERNIS